MTAIPLQFGVGFPLAGAFGIGPMRGSKQKSAPKQQRMIQSKETGVAQRANRLVEAVVDQRSDEYLLDSYLRGDRAAFTTLMGRYSNELLHFLTRFLGSRAAADDVFQETFLQIHLSADTFDSERRFKPWLFTIAANKARDYHRKHSRGNQV